MSQNAIRIRLRQGSSQEWSLAEELTDSRGNLASGEFGLVIDENTDETHYIVKGHIGINSTPTPISNCPVVFMAEMMEDPENLGIYSFISTRPVIYEKPEEIPANSIVSWNEDDNKWEVVNSAVLLNSLPTTSGTLFYNQETNTFDVGEIIFASEIDGGSYGETDE
jgi:hypothetical protein